MDKQMRISWGVLGSAGINNAAIPGMLKANNARLLAVSSRRPNVAEADRRRWGAERAYDSYDALLGDRDVDAVYIPLPNHLHAEWVVKALQAGKHVLCEKPLVLSLAEVDAISEAAQRAGRVVMEGFMYRFAPRWIRAIELIRSGAIGEPRLVRITRGFKQFYDSYNIRFDPAVGGGVLWDMGSYAVNMSRLVFDVEPRRALATSWSRPKERVDTTTSAILDFGGGRSAVFTVSFDFVNPFAQFEVIGLEGWISLQGTGTRGEPFTRIVRHRYGDEIFSMASSPRSRASPPRTCSRRSFLSWGAL